MPLQSLGITRADLDAMHLALKGLVPASSREEFPDLLLHMLELKSIRFIVTAEEILVEIVGDDISCSVPRPARA